MASLRHWVCGFAFAFLLIPFSHAATFNATAVSADTPSAVSASGVTDLITYAVEENNAGALSTLYQRLNILEGAATMGELAGAALTAAAVPVALYALVQYLNSQGATVTPASGSNSGSIVGQSINGSYSSTTYRQVFGCANVLNTSVSGCLSSARAAYVGQPVAFDDWSSSGYCEGHRTDITAGYNIQCLPYCQTIATGALTQGFCNSATLPAGKTDSAGHIPVSWAPWFSSADSTGAQSLTGQSLWNMLYGQVSTDQAKQLITDPSGTPWWTPEVQSGAQQAANNAAQTAGGTSVTTGQPTPNSSGSGAPVASPAPLLTSPSDSPQSQASQQASASSTPAFCTWASTLCNWLGWSQLTFAPPTDPALPSNTLQTSSWDSGLSSGTCPAPIVVSVLGASVSVTWQPLCDLASMLRPLLIGLAGLSAALILLGQRAGGGSS